MKRNGIIYPNTPFFRKYAGKLIIPACADGDSFLFYAAWMEVEGGEYILVGVAISASTLTGITFEVDGEAGGEAAETIVDENLISEFALAGITIPTSCIGMNAALSENTVTAGEHTVSATFEGVTKEETVTVG